MAFGKKQDAVEGASTETQPSAGDAESPASKDATAAVEAPRKLSAEQRLDRLEHVLRAAGFPL